MYTARSAVRISQGWLFSEAWNARAVPWNAPCTEVGTPMRCISVFTASVASDRDTPTGRLKLIVEAANCDWWFTARGVLVASYRAKVESGTCRPPGAMTYTSLSDSGLCQNSGAASI